MSQKTDRIGALVARAGVDDAGAAARWTLTPSRDGDLLTDIMVKYAAVDTDDGLLEGLVEMVLALAGKKGPLDEHQRARCCAKLDAVGEEIRRRMARGRA